MAVPANVAAAAEVAFNEWAVAIVQTTKASAVPLQQAIDRLLKRGLSESEIFETLTKDLETDPMFGSFLKKVNDETVDPGVKRTMDDIAKETWGEQQLWQWQSINDERRCPDCESRHGQIKTEDEWLKLGEPTWGGTRCGFNCRCKLVPSGKATDEPIVLPKRKKKKT